jgi:hypothetical protein
MGPAHAEDAYENLELDTIISARSRAALEQRLALIESLRRHDDACLWQLERGKLPYSCYLAEPLMAKLGMKPPKSRLILDDRCEKIAKTTFETEIDEHSRLPAPCLRLARNRVRVNRYRLGKEID